MPSAGNHWKKRAPFFLLFIVMAGGLLSLLVMYLWNNVLVPVTDIREVTFWQAAGLLLLSRILFGGFKGGPWQGKRGSGMHRGRSSHWRKRWENMSDEEREALKNRWKEKCKD